MIDIPEMVRTEAQTAAVIRLKIPRDQMEGVMGPAIDELMGAVSDQGLKQLGPVFAHHLTLSSEFFDFEVGIPVNAPVARIGRVIPGELPAATVVRTVYQGGYEGLYAAWTELGKRTEKLLGRSMQDEGLEPGETVWERYVRGPESDPDPNTWRTELNLPLREIAP